MGDIYAKYNRLDRTFTKIEKAELSSSNKQYLEEFTEHLMAQGLSDHKIYRYIQTFRVLSDEIDFDLKDATRRDMVRLIGKINQNQIQGKDYAPESKLELKKAFKKFYKWDRRTDHPELLDFMTLNLKKSERKRVDPSELPTREQVMQLIEAAKNPRDKAMIYLLWESGARIGEFLPLDWSDIKADGDLYRVKLDGKTGQRTVPVTECISYLEEWRDYQYDHYEPVVTSFHSENRASYSCVRKQLREARKRADVDCKVNPQAFRKARATYLAGQGANIFQLMNIFGWSKAETAKVYVRLAQSDVDDLVLEVAEI